MGGLIEQADGGKRRPEHTPDTARHAWQESMLRPIDELGQALRRLEPNGLAILNSTAHWPGIRRSGVLLVTTRDL